MGRHQVHRCIYLLGLATLLAAIPLSHFLMGLAYVVLAANWFLEWNWSDKWALLKRNYQALVWAGLFVFSILGFIRTEDWARAGHVFLSQAAFFAMPVIMATTRPLSNKQRDALLDVFVLATFVGTICALLYWKTHTVSDMREISRFIDHIRFSLCIVLSVVFCLYAALHHPAPSQWRRMGYLLLACWLVGYLFIAQTLTGIAILFALVVSFLVYVIACVPHKRTRTLFIVLSMAIVTALASYVGILTYHYFHDQDTMILARQTERGNRYSFNPETVVENGHRIDYYVCRPELREAWALRSDSAYNELREQTLIRYLNSKGLRKDYAAVMSLTAQDVANVERGIANVQYAKPFGLGKALYSTYFGMTLYAKYGYISNSSFLERVELWRASWQVVKAHPFLGVGLGDYKAALDQQLCRQESPIAHKKNRGSHNQFLTFWLKCGVFYLAYFIFALLYPFLFMRTRISLRYTAFAIVMVLSMLVEDTLGQQTGLMLYVVLTPLLLFGEE